RSFSHENILKFTGYYAEKNYGTVCIFSPYMRNGNAQTYLAEKQATTEERFFLLRDALMGLDYLHNLSPPVVHGDLKAVCHTPGTLPKVTPSLLLSHFNGKALYQMNHHV
ncbi:hypothetical protein M407DRAFT_82436, partial [Tulasnella calospora MUT 4182]